MSTEARRTPAERAVATLVNELASVTGADDLKAFYTHARHELIRVRASGDQLLTVETAWRRRCKAEGIDATRIIVERRFA